MMCPREYQPVAGRAGRIRPGVWGRTGGRTRTGYAAAGRAGVLRLWAFGRNDNRLNVIPEGESWVYGDTHGLIQGNRARAVSNAPSSQGDDGSRAIFPRRSVGSFTWELQGWRFDVLAVRRRLHASRPSFTAAAYLAGHQSRRHEASRFPLPEGTRFPLPPLRRAPNSRFPLPEGSRFPLPPSSRLQIPAHYCFFLLVYYWFTYR